MLRVGGSLAWGRWALSAGRQGSATSRALSGVVAGQVSTSRRPGIVGTQSSCRESAGASSVGGSSAPNMQKIGVERDVHELKCSGVVVPLPEAAGFREGQPRFGCQESALNNLST
jgi:hypothetical protein